ncbi:hypothetical protein NUU61_002556 [Penicillium alfredii]|uniref:Uncharacterized protein n=1 Tax=Penicillium alfredii TaxID=1506179 RepID=A0A9W9KG30_9EURO|nr:uncharacterized protein NUU61_002556 [Penicillium alfredii]KAJ5105209.1 hypothetical protein NUU61_002556 [Penicillium alfredii]
MQLKLSAATALLATIALAVPVPTGQDSSCAQVMVKTLNTQLQGNNNPVEVGPKVVTGTRQTVATLTKTQPQSCQGKLSDEDQKQVCDAATKFINEDDTLVKPVTDKQDLLANIPLNAPIAAAYLQSVIEFAPNCGPQLTELIKNLDKVLSKLAGAYSN